MNLPDLAEFMTWPWEKIAPYYDELRKATLTADSVKGWLADWSRLGEYLHETASRLHVAVTVDTTDEEAHQRFEAFIEGVLPEARKAEQALAKKLVESGLEPEGFCVPLRNMRAEIELFREENLPLQVEEEKLRNAYNQVVGAQTVEWHYKEYTVSQMRPFLQEPDRTVREEAWRLMTERQLRDRGPLTRIWQQMLDLRQQMAANADKPDYRAFRWQQMGRFDYTPDDCRAFHKAIEEVVVPAAAAVLEKRRQRLGLDRLRPWDLNVDPAGRPPLRPFRNVEELKEKSEAIFHHVDPQLGAYYHTMREENLLDLENRKGKAPGGYCTAFPVSKRPFIFMNAVGVHDDVQTMFHESGHAFHVFESLALPYLYHQGNVPMEFAEVASMSMELLASPYLTHDFGGFYTPHEAARARIEHLERSLLFWPYMAVVDAFQHWVYEHPEEAHDPAECDRIWGGLWDRFMPVTDWRGLEDAKVSGWMRKLHIFQYPFYYVEYGLAQLGAVQVWANALEDQQAAVAAYRKALALGGTVTLPELYAAAGAKFAMDAATLRKAVDLMMRVIEELETVAEGGAKGLGLGVQS
ncbi:MAG TPA: M3 family oligoendopeptidase [Chloroflexi bacterium]|nr:M3 family oligoendopeptidase [Chloroflexota bacterium]